MNPASGARAFHGDGGLRNDIEKAILASADLAEGSETDPVSLVRLIGATTEAGEWCGKLQRAAVHQARRAEIPWSEIGAVMGITRQAAQQRFAPEEDGHPPAENTRRIPGATAFNEMQILQSEGRAGYHLVGFGPLFLTVMASAQVWEHRRLHSLSITARRAHMEANGWIYVGSWFPFHYYKRIVP